MDISKVILALLLSLVDSSFARYVPDFGVAFGPSDGEIVNDIYIKWHYEGIYGKAIDFNKIGLHIIMQKTKSRKDSKGYGIDFCYGFVPFGSDKMQISCVPKIPTGAGPTDAKWLECNNRIIQRHADFVSLRCTKARPVQSNLYHQVHSFIEQKSLSIYNAMGDPSNGGNLYIVYVDELGRNFFFQILPPEKILDYFESKAFVTEYTDLYDGLGKLMMTGFEECRWSNLGNVKELMAECSEWSGWHLFKDVLRQVEEDAR